MSTVIAKNVQVGTSGTASNNFTLYQPAAPDGTVRLANGNSGSTTDRVTVTSAGNVGIGTSSPKSDVGLSLHFFNSANTGTVASNAYMLVESSTRNANLELSGSSTSVNSYSFSDTPGTAVAGIASSVADQNLQFRTGGTTERMRIDSTGNVGIGTSSPNGKLDVKTASDSKLIFNDGTTTGNVRLEAVNNAYSAYKPLELNGSVQLFATGGTERARIDSSGNLLVGTTNTSLTAGVGVKFISSATEPYIAYVINSAGGSNYHLYNTNATNNGFRFYVTTNGGIVNYAGNNVNLSDERTKTNIELAGSYLNKICSIPVKLFNYKDEAEGEQQTLGVIAQDVEAVAPELVNNEGFGETPEDGLPLKSIYTTDMQFALMKCIQEQQALIQSLTARLDAANL
jgi:hypothetical protein